MRKVELKLDDQGNIQGIRVKSDLSPFVRAIQAERAENSGGWTRKRTLRKVASIPLEALQLLPPDERRAVLRGSKKALRRFLKKHPVFATEGVF